MATSWFAEPELMPTTTSASYVCNNLSRHGDALVYAHVDDAVRVNTAVTPYVVTRLPCAEKSFVHQVRFCSLGDTVLIVVASDNGLQIYDATGEQCFYELGVKETTEESEEAESVYCQGICAVNSSQPRLLVGNSLGRLLVIGKERESKATDGPEFDLLETLREHSEAITCVESCASGTLVASGDASGAILVRNPEDNFELVHRIAGNGYPVSCLAFLHDKRLVSGDITGKLRVYGAQDFPLIAEVAAHSRAITALDSRDDLIVSVSEDTFMNVWELNSVGGKAGTRVKLASSQQVPNDLLVGVTFATSSGKNLFTVAYDTSHLKLWVPE